MESSISDAFRRAQISGAHSNALAQLIGLTPEGTLGEFRLHTIAGKSGGHIYTQAPQTSAEFQHPARLNTFSMVPKPINIDSVMIFPTGKSKIHRRYVTPGAEKNTSIDEPSPVHVRDLFRMR